MFGLTGVIRRRVVIEIADDGPGFQPDILARLGEPYNTTRARGGDEADDEGQTGMGARLFYRPHPAFALRRAH